MKCAFQLIKNTDGTRCEPFVFDRNEFVDVLLSTHTLDDCDDYYVLVLFDLVDSTESFDLGAPIDSWEVSMAPLMTIRRYVEVFGNGRTFPEQPSLSVASAADDGADE